MMKSHPVITPDHPKAARIAAYVVAQRDAARLGDAVLVPAYMAADLLKIVAEQETLLVAFDYFAELAERLERQVNELTHENAVLLGDAPESVAAVIQHLHDLVQERDALRTRVVELTR